MSLLTIFDAYRAIERGGEALRRSMDTSDLGGPRGDPPEFLTVDEVADLLRCDRKAVYEAVRHGQIPCLRIGRLVRVRRTDLVRFTSPGQGRASGRRRG